MSGIPSELADGFLPPDDMVALTVDTTSRNYDLSVLNIQDEPFMPGAQAWFYFTIQADGGTLYFAFDDASSRPLDETAKIAAGSALSYNANYCYKLTDGNERSFMLSRTKHRYLHIKGSASMIARFGATSMLSGGAGRGT